MEEQDGRLLWTKPSWLRREFVLTRGGRVLARLTFGGWGSSSATVQTREGWWTISRDGFWRPRITMQGGATLLAARASWSGNYELESGIDGALRWGCLSFWKQQFGWSRADGAPLIRYRPESAFCQRVHFVDLLGGGELTESRLLLVVLGGYFLQRTQEDSAAAAVAASA